MLAQCRANDKERTKNEEADSPEHNFCPPPSPIRTGQTRNLASHVNCASSAAPDHKTKSIRKRVVEPPGLMLSCQRARVAELAAAPDSNSRQRKSVCCQFPPLAP